MPNYEIPKIKINKEADILDIDEVFSDAYIFPEKADPAGRRAKNKLSKYGDPPNSL